MKPGLFLPRIPTSGALDVSNVDGHLNLLYGQVNGGLTAESLSPTEKLAASKFAEDHSLFVMEGQGFNRDTTNRRVNCGILQYKAKLFGVGWVVKRTGNPVGLDVLTIYSNASGITINGIERSEFTNPIDGAIWSRGFFMPENSSAAAWLAGHQISISYGIGSTFEQEKYTLFFAAQHVA